MYLPFFISLILVLGNLTFGYFYLIFCPMFDDTTCQFVIWLLVPDILHYHLRLDIFSNLGVQYLPYLVPTRYWYLISCPHQILIMTSCPHQILICELFSSLYTYIWHLVLTRYWYLISDLFSSLYTDIWHLVLTRYWYPTSSLTICWYLAPRPQQILIYDLFTISYILISDTLSSADTYIWPLLLTI